MKQTKKFSIDLNTSNNEVTLFYGTLQMGVPVLAEQQELIYISSVWTQDVV